MDYDEALHTQRNAAAVRMSGELPNDLLILVEHPPVVTLGRSARGQNLIASPEFLATRGVEVYEVERGGDVTFHGPGQLVGYPILNLREHRKDLHWYLRTLESSLVASLRELGLVAEAREGLTGVWTGGRKIASIGVHARDWVTWHGFALNVNTDLSYFDFIVPCGIEGVVMTSVARELGAPGDMAAVRDVVVRCFADAFGLEAVPATLQDLAPTMFYEHSGGATGSE
jgi:lipoyl(octanoyl) transferase